MADVLTGKIWTLGSGTLGVVTSSVVQIDKIRVTWSGASNGYVSLVSPGETSLATPATILSIRTLGAASATNGWVSLTEEFNFDGLWVSGITKVAATGLDGEVGIQIQIR